MKIEIQIDEKCTETRVSIVSNAMSQEITDIVNKLSDTDIIAGIKNGVLEIIEMSDIICVFATDQKVFAKTAKGKYILKLRLYEVENKLNNAYFVRISNSEIINLKKVLNFDLNYGGTICVELCDDTVTRVSRRYVSKIKKILGV